MGWVKKLLIFVVLLAGLIYWFKGFVQSGNLEKYLDAHPNESINPSVEYYWGMMLNFADRKDSAVYRLSRVVSKYPKSKYAADAWIECILILDDMGNRSRVLEEAKSFMQSEYSNSPRAEVIKRKIAVIEHGF
jgi:TolA-binding protein